MSALILTRLAVNNLDIVLYQIWFLVLAIIPFINLFEFGSGFFFANVVADKNTRNISIGVMVRSYLLAVFFSIFGIGVIIWGVSLISFPHIQYNKIPEYFVVTFIGSSVARILANIFQGVLYGCDEVVFEKSLRLASAIIYVITGGIALSCGCNIFALPIGIGVSALFSITISSVYAWKLKKIRFFDLGFDFLFFLKSLKHAGKFLAITLPGVVVLYSTPFFVAKFLTPVDSVILGLFGQIASGCSILVSAPMLVFAPRIAKDSHSNVDRPGFFFSTVAFQGAILAGLASGLIWNYAPYVLSIWTGFDYEIPAYFIGVFSIMWFLEWQQTNLTSLAMVNGFYNFSLITAASAAIIVILSPVFIDKYGLVGAVLIVFIAQLITCHPYNVVHSCRVAKVRVGIVFFAALCGFVTFLLLLGLHRLSVYFFENANIIFGISLFFAAFISLFVIVFGRQVMTICFDRWVSA